MRPVDDAKGITAESTVIMLTGDGSRERRVLRAIATRFDGDVATLLISTLPLPVGREPQRPRSGRESGLSALPAVRTYAGKLGITRSLFMVDREHLHQNQETCCSMIQSTLQECGMRNIHLESPEEHAFFVECFDGCHQVAIHLVVSGDHSNIEENIAALINLEHQTTVEPTKASIDCALSQLRTNLSQLIRDATPRNLDAAFPGLTVAMRRIEEVSRRPP